MNAQLALVAVLAAFAGGGVFTYYVFGPGTASEGPSEPSSQGAKPGAPAAPQSNPQRGGAAKPSTSEVPRMPGVPVEADTEKGFFHKAPEWLIEADKQAATDDPSQVAADTPYHNAVRPAPLVQGVTRYDAEKAYDGVNLVISAHRPEAALVDMKGRLLHTWTLEYGKAFKVPKKFFEWTPHQTSWRRVHVYPNGDLLAIFEGIGMVKLDADSNLLWKHGGRAHHDIFVDDDGLIHTLARSVTKNRMFPVPILEDFVLVISPDGKTVERHSLLEALYDSPFRWFTSLIPNINDIFHANTVEVLDGRLADRIPAFAAGNWLVSMRNLDTIAVIDRETKRCVWAMAGQWKMQHQPTVLENGNVLLFDNMGVRGAPGGGSRVIEFDPATREIHWSYQGTKKETFDTPYLGSSSRLPNGNTLITESVTGRAFEVTRDGEIVWEYVNPHRGGDNNELIATLCEVVRLEWSDVDFGAVREARQQLENEIEIEGAEQLLEKGK